MEESNKTKNEHLKDFVLLERKKRERKKKLIIITYTFLTFNKK